MDLAVWGHTPRPWGYEVRCDFVDDNGRNWNEVLTWPKEPDEKAIDAAVAARLEAVTARVAAEAVEAQRVPEPTPEDLKARVVELEAQVAAVTIEKEALAVERDTLIAVHDELALAEPVAKARP